jgi:hypothetical protein
VLAVDASAGEAREAGSVRIMLKKSAINQLRRSAT